MGHDLLNGLTGRLYESGLSQRTHSYARGALDVKLSRLAETIFVVYMLELTNTALCSSHCVKNQSLFIIFCHCRHQCVLTEENLTGFMSASRYK